MPPFGYMLGNINFNELSYILKPAVVDGSGKVINEAISINYGIFIQLSIDFVLIALTIFSVIKVFNILRRKAEDPEVATVPTPRDIALLSEIRDILKSNRETKNQ